MLAIRASALLAQADGIRLHARFIEEFDFNIVTCM
tara:strand:+ start:61 stop:165 length:105 start_codon:yes stop_codon:yes gene_type:complete